ncbi:MAG: IS1634 family transposase [Acidobacteriaceae bacterium]|nr:IS1634 family transposase [Acidobacteriaceae bacterium]
MPEQKTSLDHSAPAPRRTKRVVVPGKHAQADGLQLRSYDVGALPLLTQIVERMQLQRILSQHLPKDDSRTELPTVTALLVLFANLLMAREPVYGVGEWAALFPPDLLGLREQDLSRLHDDRLGRCLDRMFEGIGPTLIMAVVRHVIREFAIGLDELHNDSTTVSFYGAYNEAGQESEQRGRPTHAITWGHSKARRPDLKQLLYTLTVTSDGNVPVYFSSASGNTVDDGTHIGTWDLLYELIGHANFLYVADCKLASSENLSHMATRGGRFVTVLPRGRTEDKAFRQRLRATPSVLKWTLLYKLANDKGHIIDELFVCEDDHIHSEGYRLLWYRSTRKAEQDQSRRARSIQKTTEALSDLRERLQGPRTRFRERAKVEQALAELLAEAEASPWLLVEIEEQEEETFRQATRGRPSEQTKYLRETRSRFTLTWKLNVEALSEAEREDGVFPLLTNDRKLSATEVLQAYKRQPLLEKRFSQFKTDFAVAPVFLKNVSRIQGLLAAYFFALLVQTLLERELRQAMARAGVATLPLYPEDRPCARPTTHRLIEVFSPIQRHEVRVGQAEAQVMVTKLTKTQRSIIRLLGLDPRAYGLA